MPLTELKATRLSDLFSALSDASRVRIISALVENEMSVGALAKKLKMSASAVSHQLRGLRLQRIVRARKQGRQVFYSLDDEHVAELFRRGLEHMEHN
ncbi:MAG: helix-turn-helix transcriptional regulator [Chloroflexi bacterium]|nr:helix-turn-helix transcriptional regulator [Chloroflexota bacterium]